jgi:pimeloyl-ACP methyl ester carboxylesterase
MGLKTLALALVATAAVAAASCTSVSRSDAKSPQPPLITSRLSGAQGVDVVLVPGLAGGDLAWRETAIHLAATHRVHEIRIAGLAGNSGAGPSSIRELAEALATYIRDRAIKPVIVIGHSAGGVAALDLGINHPDFVSRVVVIDALPFMSANSGSTVVDEALRTKAVQETTAILSESPTAFAERMHSQAKGGVGSQAAAQKISLDSAQSLRSTYAALFGDLMTLDLRPKIKRIRSPVIVIFADQAPHGAPPGHMKKRYAGQYQGIEARLIEIPNARHYVMLDQPTNFLSAVDAAVGE